MAKEIKCTVCGTIADFFDLCALHHLQERNTWSFNLNYLTLDEKIRHLSSNYVIVKSSYNVIRAIKGETFQEIVGAMEEIKRLLIAEKEKLNKEKQKIEEDIKKLEQALLHFQNET